MVAFSNTCENQSLQSHIKDSIAQIKKGSDSYPNAMAHVMGKRVNNEYIFSEALVKMDGPHPEEELGQLLMSDLTINNVAQDEGFFSTIAFRMPSPFFRQRPLA